MRTSICVVLACVAWLGLNIGAAYPHSFYSTHCCSGDGPNPDCRPVADEEVEEMDDGAWRHKPTGLIFRKDQVRPTQDKHIHVCIWRGEPRCIYIRNSV
jgi:hypothetical protein